MVIPPTNSAAPAQHQRLSTRLRRRPLLRRRLLLRSLGNALLQVAGKGRGREADHDQRNYTPFAKPSCHSPFAASIRSRSALRLPPVTFLAYQRTLAPSISRRGGM